MKRSMANLKSMPSLVLEFGKERCTCKFVWDVIKKISSLCHTLPCNFCGFNKKLMFPTNHNGRTKLKAPSYMMLNPEQQHGPTSSFSLAATALRGPQLLLVQKSHSPHIPNMHFICIRGIFPHLHGHPPHHT